jgi:hypothetical protein
LVDKSEIEKAFGEPFDAFAKWLSSDFDRIDAQLKEQMNEGVLADIFGETSTPISRLRSREDELRARFGYSLMSLLSSVYRLERIKKMLKHFPAKRSGISKGDHIENCTIVLFNEVYVIEERLKGFLRECQAIEIELCGSSSIQPGKVARIYQTAFKGFLSARGGHTHRTDFEDKRIKRIQLIELLMRTKDFDFLRLPLSLAIKDARGFWLQRVDEAEDAAKRILALGFKQVRPLCRALFPSGDKPKTGTHKKNPR